MKRIAALIFPGFELLDLYGPLEMFGLPPNAFDIRLVAESHDPVASAQGPRAAPDATFDDDGPFDVILAPGGGGTRREIDNPVLIDWLRRRSEAAEWVLTVCTGAALLAKTGLLDGRAATTNKRAFDWVAGQRSAVDWRRSARWVEDGKFFTSSGVSAGMDMSLAAIARILDVETAEKVADWSEYLWNRDPDSDPFATG